MAPTLFQKLFSKRATATGGARECARAAEQCWASADFDLAQIRLIVYQDCERRGRQVLFDSKAIRKLDPSESYTRPASDVNMLGEMMFGSVAMSYKGSTLKIHHIRSPPQLMVSKVFSTQYGSSNTGSTNTLQDSFESISQTCPSHTSSIAHSNPVDMPGRGHSEDGDSGIARSASLSSLLATPLPSPGSSSGSGCASSYQRRWLRSQATSLQHGPIPRWSTEEMFSLSDESCSSNPAMARRKKIAVSIIISLPEKEEESRGFQEFFFSHFPLFESHMNKLKTAIERNSASPNYIFHLRPNSLRASGDAMIVCRRVAEASQRVQVYLCRVMEALGEFRMTVWNLYMAPRITEPVWLTMVSQSAERNQLCLRFLKEMSLLMEHGAKNQFLSALLTAVLMYHLAWVPTVMPTNHLPIKPVCQKHASHTVDLLAKSHPYNPLWAQLGDLYGALGSPVRVCRTVVVGRRRELVQRVLYVLSYFIRCSDLQENTQAPGHTDSPANPCQPQTTNPTPLSHRTNEKPLMPESELAKPALCPERTNEKTLGAELVSERTSETSESPEPPRFPEMTTEGLVCDDVGQECFGGTHDSVGAGLEHILASQSPPVQRVQFTIGSPKEAEQEARRCGRGLHRKLPHRLLTDIQRNESSDSSLGDSDEEDPSPRQSYAAADAQEHELPLPSCQTESRPSVNHFGRSLLGGYCPQYMPDFALHGISSDQRLKQCLMADLEHTVLHPSLDEPVAEALCIVADTDRLCVQVATSQRRVCEPGRLGRDVMVSGLIHTLLTSVLQLHTLNIAADFIMDFPGHFEQIFQQLNYQRVHGQLCDCVIVVGNRHFKAHRAVLAACSTHFRALFTVAENDSSMSMIQLDSEVVTAEAFAALVDMMYTSTLMLGESNVMDVLLAASHLHLNTVVKACKHYLTTRTLPMSPPGERGSQHQGSQVAAAANSRLQRSFLLQQLGLSLVSSALNGAEEGSGAGRGTGSVSGSGLAEQRDSYPSRRFHKRKQAFSLIRSEAERMRQRTRLSSQSEGTMMEREGGTGGEELLSPDSHNKVEDSKLDVVVAGDDSDLLEGRNYRRSMGQEDVQLPSQSDGGRVSRAEQPLLLPHKEEYPDTGRVQRDGVQVKDGGEDEETQQVVVKSEPLSSPEPADETSDVTSQAEGSDQVEAVGEKLELSPEGSDQSFTDPQSCSDLLLTGSKGPAGGVERGGGGREELSCSEALESTSGFRISSFLSTKSFECGTLSSNPAENVPNTTTGESRLDHEPSRFLFGSDSTSTSATLLLPPSQNLLSGETQDFSALSTDALVLHPMHDGVAASSSSLGNSRGGTAEQFSFQRNSLGMHAFPRLSRGGTSGFPAYRRIAPKVTPGGASMRSDGSNLHDVASSSSSALLNGTSFDGTVPGGQHGNASLNPPPQLTRASADVLSKCKKALSEHNVLVVEGARKYACKICCKTFLTLTDCKKHIRVHTGEKPYACLKCGKRFSQSSHLYKHSKTTCLRWQSANMSNALL
ncbi:hypothetical protein NFI96_000508 [Prochilodus magdalenae]|nr:hypothetical protein NFI96_000508 [Prochilodus magdalenae]